MSGGCATFSRSTHDPPAGVQSIRGFGLQPILLPIRSMCEREVSCRRRSLPGKIRPVLEWKHTVVELVMNQWQIPWHCEFLSGAPERGSEDAEQPVGDEERSEEGDDQLSRGWPEDRLY